MRLLPRASRSSSTVVEFLIVLVVLVVVVLVISAPLRRAPVENGAEPKGPSLPAERADDLAELQAAREAKYREIRDAELDRATGKLSDEDHHALDARLRAEALEILHAIDRLAAGR
jgi:hypothetical protein